MHEPGVARFLRLLEYETWANERGLASLASVPAEQRARPAYARATQLLPHIALARTVWLMRIRGVPFEHPEDWFPSWDSAQAAAELKNLDAQWGDYLGSLRDQDLARAVRYTSSEGMQYVSTVEEVCTHVFNHSTYHRGQLARLVHESGGQRASTDLIAMTRRTG